MKAVVDDLRIKEIKELCTPSSIIAEVPSTAAIASTVAASRLGIHKICMAQTTVWLW